MNRLLVPTAALLWGLQAAFLSPALPLIRVTTLPLAVVALVVLGGPAGVGSSLLYAHLRHSGGSTADVVNTRAIFSVG